MIGSRVTVVWCADVAWCWPGGSGGVGESFEQGGDCGVPVVDGGAFVVGEWDGGEHAEQVRLPSSSWALLEPLGV